MQALLEKIRQRRIQKAARDYESQGYQVTVAPPKSETPDFLALFEIDLLARKERENVVALVRTKPGLSQGDCLHEIAEALKDRPDWRLDLIVANPKRLFPEEQEANLLDRAEITARLAQCETLLSLGHTEAALLLAWSALEATFRHIARREKIRLQTAAPAVLVETFYSEGILNYEDYETLEKAGRLRDSLSQGYETLQLDDRFVRDVIESANRLL